MILACLVVGSAFLAWPARAQITVGQNVQVTAALSRQPHFEMLMAADPAHPGRLMACSMVLPTDHRNSETVTYISLDAGASWQLALRLGGDGGRESWDPDCLYGLEGVAYSLSEGMDSTDGAYLRIDRSIDGGRTWSSSRRVKHFERTFAAIDRSHGPRRGWLYLHGQEGTRTTGGPRNFGSAVGLHLLSPNGEIRTTVLSTEGDRYVVGVGPGVVLSDGTFVGMFHEFPQYWASDGVGQVPPNILGRAGESKPNAKLKALRLESTAWRPSVVTVGDFYSAWSGSAKWHLSVLNSMAADAGTGPFRDRIYAVWTDLRSGRGEIYLSYSADSGKTWSAARVVNDDRPRRPPQSGPHHLQPVVAVNSAGVVGVAWYDRREQSDDLGWDVRFSASLDGGDTFLPSVKISEQSHSFAVTRRWDLQSMSFAPGTTGDPSAALIGLHSFNFTGGHTAGMAADASGSFHPLWVSNATGVAQLWTASVRVAGQVIKNGDSTLSSLTDVTQSLRLEFLNAHYDPKAYLVETDLVLRNVSNDTVIGPVAVRLVDLRSEFGLAKVIGADNGRPGAGAIWRFAADIGGNLLRPGEATLPKRVRFGLEDAEPLHVSIDAVIGLVVPRIRVFAKRLEKPSP